MWAPYFQRPNSPVTRAIEQLIKDQRAALIGPIVAEVLYGFRIHQQAEWAASRLRRYRYIEVTLDDWIAARLGRDLASRGHKLPMSDLAIAAVAQRLNISVYTTDPDFDLISPLDRYVA